MLYDLESALYVIKSTMYHHKNNEYFPYFFIVGAGISVPEIPTASEIVDICKKTVQQIDPDLFLQHDEKLKDVLNDGMKYYSSWIECAYPNRIDRSNLFKDFCNKAKISSANLMLAQILHSEQFANTVFTTNFDDSIKKALELMGTKNFFCAENSMDNLVVSNQNKAIQIIHVHGTFAFYDCANLEKEINSIASQPGAISSAQVLSSFLSNQAPIIVGYSGWENDVIMRCLKDRLNYPTPLKYIWICHNKQSYQSLPGWIKENDNIIFVVPETNKGDCNETYDNISWDSSSTNDSIDAAMFFKRIISSFKLPPPLIFTDPYAYYSERIHSILPKNEDVLHLRHWAQRLKTIESDDVFEKLVQRLEVAYISKDYEEATSVLNAMEALSLNEANVQFVCSSLVKEFIRDGDIVSSIDLRLKFHLAALAFIEKNLQQLSSTSSLISTLRAILFIGCRHSEKEKVLNLIDRVISLSRRDDRLLVVELAAIGTKSDLIDHSEKEKMLHELLARYPEDTSDKEFIFIRYRALCELGKISSPDDAVNFIEEAEQLSKVLDSHAYFASLCLAKAEILPTLVNKDVKANWWSDIFELLSNPSEDVDLDIYIEIVANLSLLPDDFFFEYANNDSIETIIISLLTKYSIDDTRCSSILHYSQCCELVIRVTKSQAILEEFCNKVFGVMLSFPHECSSYIRTLYFTAKKYMLQSAEIVSDELKVGLLTRIKENEYTKKIYRALLYFAFYQDLIKDFSQFSDDIDYINEQEQKLSDGYKRYCDGDHKNAEVLFSEVMSCEVPIIVGLATTNLAYMVRREETEREYSFEDLICKKANLDTFDLINIFLYFTTRGETKNDMCLMAEAEIKKISEAEKERIRNWWSNVDLVGQEESNLVLSLIDSY